jgi:hypothetical protein
MQVGDEEKSDRWRSACLFYLKDHFRMTNGDGKCGYSNKVLVLMLLFGRR